MEYFESFDNSFGKTLHDLITELANISELSQLIKMSANDNKFEEYCNMMLDISGQYN